MAGKFEDALISVKRDKKQRFTIEVNNCKQYQDFLNPPVVPIGNEDNLKNQASESVLKILLNYGFQQDETAIYIEEVLNNKIENMINEIRTTKRDPFKDDCLKCQSLQRYWAKNQTNQKDETALLISSLKSICTRFNAKDQ